MALPRSKYVQEGKEGVYHCFSRAEDHIIRPGYRLTSDQVITAISDCTSLANSYWNMNYTGGEPTLWEENGKDLADMLIATAKAGILPTYNTNGSYFVVVIVTKDPNSSLPEEMKKCYASKGITFGDFPMLNIGKAKNLSDQLPEFAGFNFELPRIMNGPQVLTLVGDDYYAGDKKIGKLGHMMDLYSNAHCKA
jgi:hypothetical protein